MVAHTSEPATSVQAIVCDLDHTDCSRHTIVQSLVCDADHTTIILTYSRDDHKESAPKTSNLVAGVRHFYE